MDSRPNPGIYSYVFGGGIRCVLGTDRYAKDWNEQGKLTYTTEYKDDKKQGADRRRSERTGKLVEAVMFANDERNGLKREFNERTGKGLSALP